MPNFKSFQFLFNLFVVLQSMNDDANATKQHDVSDYYHYDSSLHLVFKLNLSLSIIMTVFIIVNQQVSDCN